MVQEWPGHPDTFVVSYCSLNSRSLVGTNLFLLYFYMSLFFLQINFRQLQYLKNGK